MRTKTVQLNKIFLVITVITGVVITCGVFAFANNEADITITIECFYFNACASCNEETKLLQQFQDLIGETQSHVKIIYRMHNTFHTNETEILKQYYEKYNIPGNKRYMPILFIGDTYLPGEDEIKAGLKQAVNEQMQKNGMDTPDLSWQVAGDKQKKYTVTYTKTNDTEVIYFYLPSCGDCEKVEKVLDRLPGSVKLEQGNELINSRIKIIKLNAGEEDNLDILKARFEYLNVPVEEQQVPIVFLGDTWISGASNIQSKLENAILSGHGIGTVQVLTTGESKPSDAGVLNLLSVFLTGLVNGLSPCSLSMLILFFSLLISNEKVKLLGAGITFIAGKFLAFILLGTLLYRFFVNADFHWFQTLSKVILVCLGSVFIILNIRDYFAAKNEEYNKILLQLPERLRKFDHNLIKTVSGIKNYKVFVPVCFILGVLIAAGEFLCTGQIYLATIVLMLQRNPYPNFNVAISFVLYGIAFVLPLLIITIILSKGKAAFEVSEAVREKMPLIKMINALFFLIFITIILFTI